MNTHTDSVYGELHRRGSPEQYVDGMLFNMLASSKTTDLMQAEKQIWDDVMGASYPNLVMANIKTFLAGWTDYIEEGPIELSHEIICNLDSFNDAIVSIPGAEASLCNEDPCIAYEDDGWDMQFKRALDPRCGLSKCIIDQPQRGGLGKTAAGRPGLVDVLGLLLGGAATLFYARFLPYNPPGGEPQFIVELSYIVGQNGPYGPFTNFDPRLQERVGTIHDGTTDQFINIHFHFDPSNPNFRTLQRNGNYRYGVPHVNIMHAQQVYRPPITANAVVYAGTNVVRPDYRANVWDNGVQASRRADILKCRRPRGAGPEVAQPVWTIGVNIITAPPGVSQERVDAINAFANNLVAQGYFTDEFFSPIMQGPGGTFQWPAQWGPIEDYRSESPSFRFTNYADTFEESLQNPLPDPPMIARPPPRAFPPEDPPPPPTLTAASGSGSKKRH
jgi:hypothetical protein